MTYLARREGIRSIEGVFKAFFLSLYFLTLDPVFLEVPID